MPHFVKRLAYISREIPFELLYPVPEHHKSYEQDRLIGSQLNHRAENLTAVDLKNLFPKENHTVEQIRFFRLF